MWLKHLLSLTLLAAPAVLSNPLPNPNPADIPVFSNSVCSAKAECKNAQVSAKVRVCVSPSKNGKVVVQMQASEIMLAAYVPGRVNRPWSAQNGQYTYEFKTELSTITFDAKGESNRDNTWVNRAAAIRPGNASLRWGFKLTPKKVPEQLVKHRVTVEDLTLSCEWNALSGLTIRSG
ncbi:hypothetical protein LOZ12_004495 [Ophidiomyces ophidiicola]|uniref:Uncharacterized protein n=1 Tax=Ophidiomyces ophidiicola TaxID=1387563 RepID=A0ACB8UZ64_9EURO|nr:hypothetical protein LOZ64_004941 [Ophidiomyces ophidiicola]KAI1954785.1 hypothetical protein LOZ62_000562 [Ophidiomyces ophidiicola]KAI1970057.1 hypothetical protein LOZ56_003978 [Ophidiomyces ophidiicola]KAI2003797.1 hypothetical protein LOZ50_004639 [Ophidiomyces ophidiicola]KAI2020342.1 hypothetical protein LOZ45_005142 [Ophidiomyces ophidiicola]